MSDLEKYITTRKERDLLFAESCEVGYANFRIGELLRKARLEQGLTQNKLAMRLHTRKTAISRIENHAKDIRLSTLEYETHRTGSGGADSGGYRSLGAGARVRSRQEMGNGGRSR